MCQNQGEDAWLEVEDELIGLFIGKYKKFTDEDQKTVSLIVKSAKNASIAEAKGVIEAAIETWQLRD